MENKIDYNKLTKFPEITFGPFCAKHRININPDLGIKGELPLPQAVEILVKKQAMPEFFQVISNALPPRQGVWFACLCVRDLCAPDTEKTPAQMAAEAWVYKPDLETRKAVEQAIKDADMNDPTVAAADAAFHAIVPGLEDEVKSPAAASPAMVFGAALQSLFLDDSEEGIQASWNTLVARSLNIAAGGNGKTDEE